eukprot:PhM_4_TR10968/c0_g1_i1/m.91150
MVLFCNQTQFMYDISGHVAGAFGDVQLCQIDRNDNSSITKKFGGNDVKYCIIYERGASTQWFDPRATERVGVCVAMGCTTTELINHGKTILLHGGGTDSIGSSCGFHPSDEIPNFTAGAVGTLVVVSLLVAIALLATLVDRYFSAAGTSDSSSSSPNVDPPAGQVRHSFSSLEMLHASGGTRYNTLDAEATGLLAAPEQQQQREKTYFSFAARPIWSWRHSRLRRLLSCFDLSTNVRDLFHGPQPLSSQMSSSNNGGNNYMSFRFQPSPTHSDAQQTVQRSHLTPGGQTVSTLTATNGAALSRSPSAGTFVEDKNVATYVNQSGVPFNFMTPFNGIRAICIVWVMLYNSVLLPAAVPGVDNGREFRETLRSDVSFALVISGSFGIDTFFFISGFMTAYSVYAGSWQQQELTVKFFVKYVLLRLAKLLPMYVVVLLTSMYLVPAMTIGTGAISPFWFLFAQEISTCYDTWWSNLIFINNIYPSEQGRVCLPWTWFLSAEIQFVLVSPVFMALFRYYHKRVAMGLLVVMISVTTILSATRSTFTGSVVSTRFTYPWVRAAPFFYGMLTDAICRTLQTCDIATSVVDGHRAAKIRSWITQTRELFAKRRVRFSVGFAGICLLTVEILLSWFALASAFDTHASSFFTTTVSGGRAQQAFFTFGWGMGLLLIFLPLSLGYFRSLRTFLSSKLFAILSRLTLACYLLNPIVVSAVAASSPTLPHAGWVQHIQNFWSSVCTTLLFAVVLHVLVEKPTLRLIQVLQSP